VAVTGAIVLAGVPPTVLLLRGTAAMDIFGYLGSIATFGFLLSYALVSVAAPVFLRARGELRFKGIAFSVAALLLLAIPIVGSVYPVPEAPYSLLPYVFLALMGAGAVRVLWL
jgi:hypothetical protein